MDSVRRPRGCDGGIPKVVASAMIARRPRPESSAPPKQRCRGRNGWPLAEADKSAGIPDADRHAIQSAIAEWSSRTKRPRPPPEPK
jgi:hypothetical protein